MSLIQVTSTTAGLYLHGPGEVGPTIERALMRTRGPVVILLHGFSYQPGVRGHCPHASLFAPCGWPAGLASAPGSAEAPVIVGFGWPARGTFWQAWRAAEAAGREVARLVTRIADRAPGRPIHLFAHSLGARVVTSTLLSLEAPLVCCVTLLNGAEYGAHLERALEAPGGRGALALNVTSRENVLVDALFRRLIRADVEGAATLGQGLGSDRALTLRIDCAATREVLARRGISVAAPAGRLSHTSVYDRAGLFDLYRGVISGRIELTALARALPETRAPSPQARHAPVGLPPQPA